MSRDWINAINAEKLDLYPLQFANCDRLEKNDVVYIFDEVGTGKTISSGLMAMNYLMNSKDKKVLIITTNALSKSDGQFLSDWFGKLPFSELGLKSRIEIVNNIYSNLKKCGKEYGLVIIDEAHLFLNEDTERYDYLTNIKAEKVVFLTATPIKNDISDLNTYIKIAEKILNKTVDKSWINEISGENKEKDEIICSIFDESFPVTRYFKDTIKALQQEDKVIKDKKRRVLSELWKYNKNLDKKQVLLNHLNAIIDLENESKKENRFIIFTRFVDMEAYAIRSYLLENGFVSFDKECINNNNTKTVKVITGDNSEELRTIKDEEYLPKVLILTYQIAEQGLDLPQFNYVVNYHIPSFPSSLEQRFGRIDRIKKDENKDEKEVEIEEIHMSFLISEDFYDTNTWNFYCAISNYMYNLIPYLPSKNVIISEEILDQYYQSKEFLEQYVKKIERLIEDEKQFHLIKEYFLKYKTEYTTEKCQCNTDLWDFIVENKIEYDKNAENADELFITTVKTWLKKLKSEFHTEEKIIIYKEWIRKIGDKVFYDPRSLAERLKINNLNLQMLDAVEDCAELINQSEAFQKYKERFNENIKVPLLVKKYLHKFNQYFEDKFIENKMEEVFPFYKYGVYGYLCVFNSILNYENEKYGILMTPEEKILIFQNVDSIVNQIPFFKMCMVFKELIQSQIVTPSFYSSKWHEIHENEFREKFDKNPFVESFRCLGNKNLKKIGLSKTFIELYWNGSEYAKNFVLKKNKDGKLEASNWYKLAYHYLRKEETLIFSNISKEKDFNGTERIVAKPLEVRYTEENNPFYLREQEIKKIIRRYKKEENVSYKDLNIDIFELYKWCSANKIKVQSFFSYYIFGIGTPTEKSKFRVNPRKYVKESPNAEDGKYFGDLCPEGWMWTDGTEVAKYDVWTKGICFELYKNCKEIAHLFGNNTLGEMFSSDLLPKEYRELTRLV